MNLLAFKRASCMSKFVEELVEFKEVGREQYVLCC